MNEYKKVLLFICRVQKVSIKRQEFSEPISVVLRITRDKRSLDNAAHLLDNSQQADYL